MYICIYVYMYIHVHNVHLMSHFLWKLETNLYICNCIYNCFSSKIYDAYELYLLKNM